MAHNYVDLTHALNPGIPCWDASCSFSFECKCDYSDFEGSTKFRVHKFSMSASMGTHMDAPAHCIAGGRTIGDLTLSELIRPCVVLDVSAQANESFLLTPIHIRDFETQYGEIDSGTIVLVNSGWSRFWRDVEKYRNEYRFPSISAEAAELLLERDIAGLGVDTLSPDCPPSGSPVHRMLLRANKYLIENVAYLERMPAVGAQLYVMPLKMDGLTESPVRLFALISGK